MKFILIYPRFKTRLAGGLEEPLGILYIAAVLRKSGHRVVLFDLSFAKSLDHMKESLLEADCVGLSSSSPLFGKAIQVLKYVKSITPHVPVIIGGPHATVEPREALDAGFDYVFNGESEGIISEFASLLENGRAGECAGVASEKGTTVLNNPRRDFIADLDSIPFPARDLIDYSGYPTIGMIASRGCPFNCLYCKPMVDLLFGRKIRCRSPINVAAEIEAALRAVGRKEVYFKDDTITVLPMDWFAELEAQLLKKNLSIRWQANSRVDTVTYEKLKLMRRMGCVQLGFGVESGSPGVLEFYRKSVPQEQVSQVFGWCHDLGIIPHAFIMLGAPDETVKDLKMTYALLKKIKPRSWTVATTTPFPGNDLYTYAKKNDILNIANYEEYDNNENSQLGRMPMRLKHLANYDIKKYRDRINRHLFMINVFNPRVLMKVIRRPGAAYHKLKNILFPPP